MLCAQPRSRASKLAAEAANDDVDMLSDVVASTSASRQVRALAALSSPLPLPLGAERLRRPVRRAHTAQASALPSNAPSVAGDSEAVSADGDADAMDVDEEKPAVEGGEGKKLTAAQEAKLAAKEAKKAKQAEQEVQLSKRRKGVGKVKLADSIKRFEYLLGQTDLFQHFCDLKARSQSR